MTQQTIFRIVTEACLPIVTPSASITLFVCALLTPRHRKGREGHKGQTTALHGNYF